MEQEPDILTSVADLVAIAGKLPPSNVVVPGGHRLEDLKLVEAARDHGIVDHIILVGDRRAISRSIKELGIRIRPDRIIPASSPEAAAAATARMVTEGRADIVLKGDISTPVINRALRPLAIRPTVSLATVFDAAPIAGGRPMVLTDAGFTTVCSFGRMVDLVENACEVARLVLGIPRPRVAVLSANEKPIPSLPSTWLGEKLAGRNWENAVVYGPLSFDLATDPESVALKGISSAEAAREVAGRADVLVCPGIDTANALYKTITALSKFGLASLAGITVGFPFPYVILSRADTLETRLESIALCSVFVQRQRSSRRRPVSGRKPAASPGRVLVFQLNPGSIKTAVFSGGDQLHFREEPIECPAVDQAGRERKIKGLIEQIRRIVRSWGVRRIDAVAVPAGFLPSPAEAAPGGVYRAAGRRGGKICQDRAIAAAARSGPGSERPDNLGIPVAAGLARFYRAPAYAVDPVSDETASGATFSLRAAARLAAENLRRPPDEVKLVVACLDRGIAVAALHGETIIDSVISLPEDGPPPILPGDLLPRGAMISRVVREIGAAFAVAGCDVEAIVLTGEMIRDRQLRREIRKLVSRLAPVVALEGSAELPALARAAAAALPGQVPPFRYRPATRRSK